MLYDSLFCAVFEHDNRVAFRKKKKNKTKDGSGVNTPATLSVYIQRKHTVHLQLYALCMQLAKLFFVLF